MRHRIVRSATARECGTAERRRAQGALPLPERGALWNHLGAAGDAFEVALDYSKERLQFGRPLAGYQLMQQKLVDMALEINKGFLLALHPGRMKDGGTLQPDQISVGKLNNCREAIKIAAGSQDHPRR